MWPHEPKEVKDSKEQISKSQLKVWCLVKGTSSEDPPGSDEDHGAAEAGFVCSVTIRGKVRVDVM